MTKVIQLYDEDNRTENTLMSYTGQSYYYNQNYYSKIRILEYVLRLHNVSKVLP